MAFLKNIFGGKEKTAVAEPVRRITSEPIQSQADQEANRLRMEAELSASRAKREATKAEAEKS